MAADLGLLSLNQLQKLAQSQQNQNPNLSTSASSTWCMWNPKLAQPHHEEADDDSWEVRAFAEDTGNAMGTTWPPRSYTCTFCRREFRSAQALGGHMNVHRRDRARLHQTHPPPPGTALISNPATSLSSSSTTTLLIPTQEFAANDGFCLLYQLPTAPTAGGVFTSPPPMTDHHSPSAALLSISPYPSMALAATPPSISFPITPPPGLYNSSCSCSSSSSLCYSTKAEPNSTTSGDNHINDGNNISSSNYKETSSSIEELDLELRLGHRPTTS